MPVHLEIPCFASSSGDILLCQLRYTVDLEIPCLLVHMEIPCSTSSSSLRDTLLYQFICSFDPLSRGIRVWYSLSNFWGLLTWHKSADGLVSSSLCWISSLTCTAVSKLDSVLFAPLQGFPCLGSFAECS